MLSTEKRKDNNMGRENTRSAISKIPTYAQWKDSVILEGYRGSQSHGTYCPTHEDAIDDVDTMHIIIPPVDYYLGLKEFGSRGTREIKHNEYDLVIYEFKKFINLLLKNNPNVLGMLWLRPEHYFNLTEEGKALIEHRGLFNSKQAYFSFCGYANSQLHRMTHLAYEGYMGAKRKMLVDKHGYDCKNAAHLIRLLRMCHEFLSTHELNVWREHDSQELIEIKYGGWTLEKVKEEAERLKKLNEEAFARCTLPLRPDKEKVNELCVELLASKVGRLTGKPMVSKTMTVGSSPTRPEV